MNAAAEQTALALLAICQTRLEEFNVTNKVIGSDVKFGEIGVITQPRVHFSSPMRESRQARRRDTALNQRTRTVLWPADAERGRSERLRVEIRRMSGLFLGR